MAIKVSYKKIKCKKNWNRVIIDHYYGLSAADLIDEETLDESSVVGALLRGRAKRQSLEVTADAEKLELVRVALEKRDYAVLAAAADYHGASVPSIIRALVHAFVSENDWSELKGYCLEEVPGDE